jgi:molybdate transport system regulatory protein
MIEARLRLRLTSGDDIAIGPGKADLLEAIAATGSIAAAGRRLGMSYRRAWLLVETMNRCFRQPLVEAVKGGPRGGGARLTGIGEEVLARYRRMEALAGKAIEREVAALKRRMVGKR